MLGNRYRGTGSLVCSIKLSPPAMRGNHWDDAPGPFTYRKLLTFDADETATTVPFPTRPNIRGTSSRRTTWTRR